MSDLIKPNAMPPAQPAWTQGSIAVLPAVTLVLPNERPQSWNKSYAGQHWTKRRDEVERIRLAVRAEIDPDTVETFAGPVDVEITVYFASEPQDADNIPAKLYVDALKGWFLADDDRRFVRSVRTVTALDKANPRVVIRLAPALLERDYSWTPLLGEVAPAPPELLRYSDMLALMKQTRTGPWTPADANLADGGAALVGIGEGCNA